MEGENSVTQTEFQTKIKELWPKINEAHLTKIVEMVEYNSEDERLRMIDLFASEYKVATAPPQASHFREIMRGANIRVGKKKPAVYAYKCDVCGQYYAGRKRYYDAYKSPCCGSSTNNDRLYCNPRSDVIYVQQPCVGDWDAYIPGNWKADCTCPRFKTYQKGTGPGCDSYGQYGSLKQCGSCLCRDCCEAYTREIEEMQP
jgi:hypothetical protein